MKCIRKEYNELWSDSDESLISEIGERIRHNLNIQTKHLNLTILKNRCRKNGILGMILEAMK
jgi:hypothetical protein